MELLQHFMVSGAVQEVLSLLSVQMELFFTMMAQSGLKWITPPPDYPLSGAVQPQMFSLYVLEVKYNTTMAQLGLP